VVVDGLGNTYVVGSADGALPGQTHAGLTDAYVRKLSPSGKHLWTRQFGTAGADRAFSVALDAAGNVYVAGSASGELSGSYRGGTDAWVRKLAPNGKLRWAWQFGTPTDDAAVAVAVDRAGNAYVVGTTEGALEGPSSGQRDAFIRRYSPDGRVAWTRQFGTPGREGMYAAAVDAQGFAYVAGDTEGTLQGASAGDYDAFVRKVSPKGRAVWTRQFGSPASDDAEGIAVDGSGSVYVVGSTGGALPGLTWFGSADAFVRRYTSGGQEVWTRQFGSADSDYGVSISADQAGNAFVAGNTYAALPNQVHLGESDAYLRAYGRSGKPLWTRQFGTPAGDGADAVDVDAAGDPHVAGYTIGTLVRPPAGGSDVFARIYAAP
jgi:hypothetical protein